MNEPQWLDLDTVIDIHDEQLALFGGAGGLGDEALLESALARPINKFAYGESDAAALAAAYAFGIARNHPFIDGNKRTAFGSMIVFLGLAGLDLNASPEEATAAMLGLAAGEIDEDTFAHWIGDNV